MLITNCQKQCLWLPFVAYRTTNNNPKLCYLQYLITFVDSINVFDCRLSSVFLIYWRRSQNNLIQGLGVISCFCWKNYLFRCMFHDDTMDISAYILIKLIGTAGAWKEDIWQYNILFCILTVGKHGTDARIQEILSRGGGSRSVWQKSSDSDFFSPQLILQKSNGQFQRNLSFFKALDGVQFFSRGSNFFQGVSNCLFPIETHLICDFPVPPPPLDPHLVQPSQLHG